MLEKYKLGIFFFIIFSLIAVLFPPVEWGQQYGTNFWVEKSGYYFLFSYADAGRDWHFYSSHIVYSQLLIEVFIIVLLSLFFQMFYPQIKGLIKKFSDH